MRRQIARFVFALLLCATCGAEQPTSSPPARTGRMVLVDPARMYARPDARALAIGPRQTVLVAEGNDRIASFSIDGTRTETTLPNGTKTELVCATSDGAIWYVTGDPRNDVADSIGRIASNGAVSRFPLKHGSSVSAIAPGPGAGLWFVDSKYRTLSRIDPQARAIRLLHASEARFAVADVAIGRNGDLWIADAGTKSIVRMTPTGVRRRFPIPIVPGKIAYSADGGVWIIESGSDAIGHLTPGGGFKHYALNSAPGHYGGAAFPQAIAAADDGVWIVEGGNDNVIRIAPDGRMKTFKAPFRADPSDVVLGPDGRLWLAESDAMIGAMDRRTGATDEHALLPPEAIDRMSPALVLPLASGAMWVIGSTSFSSRSDSTGAVGLIRPDGSYVELASTGLVAAATGSNGDLWSTARYGIERLRIDGTHTSWLPGVGIEHLAADPDGSAWAIANPSSDTVYHIMADGRSQPIHVQNPTDLVRAPDGPVYVVTCPKACALRPLDSGADPKPPVPASWDPAKVAIASDGATWAGTNQLSNPGGVLHPVLYRIGADDARKSVSVPANIDRLHAAHDGSVWFADDNYQQGIVRRVDSAMHVKTFTLRFFLTKPSVEVGADTAWFATDIPRTDIFAPTFGSVAADGTIREYRIQPDDLPAQSKK